MKIPLYIYFCFVASKSIHSSLRLVDVPGNGSPGIFSNKTVASHKKEHEHELFEAIMESMIYETISQNAMYNY